MQNKILIKTSLLILILSSVGLFQFAHAQSSSAKGFGVTADFGVPFGLGIAGSYAVLPDELNARAKYNFGYDFDLGDQTSNGFKVTPELKFRTFGIFADWFPSKGGFRLTGGLGYMGETKIEASGTKAGTSNVNVSQSGNTVSITYEGKTYTVDGTKQYTIDGVTYEWVNGAIRVDGGATDTLTNNQVEGILNTVNVKSEVEWNDIAPYLGIGYGNPVKSSGGWSFNADFGLYLTGKPKISATASANCTGTAAEIRACRALVQEMNAQMDEAIKDVRDDLEKASVLPYLSISGSYSF